MILVVGLETQLSALVKHELEGRVLMTYRPLWPVRASVRANIAERGIP